MITRSITLDISRNQLASDRRAVGELYGIRAGSRVIVNVGDRWIVHVETAAHFRQNVGTLHLDLHGTQRATANWERALRTGAVE